MPLKKKNSPKPSANVTRSYCRECRGLRDHILIASECDTIHESGVTFKTTLDLIRCLGCKSLSARRDEFCDDPASVYPEEGWGKIHDDSAGRHETHYWPTIQTRSHPEWLWEIKNKSLKDTLVETYKAFNDGQPILAAAAGTRIVFDLLAAQLLEEDPGTFAAKLDALFNQGYISRRQKDSLNDIIDAGSAAQHRAHKLAHYELDLILVILESVIHQTTLATEKTEALRLRTPQRPAKVRRTTTAAASSPKSKTSQTSD